MDRDDEASFVAPDVEHSQTRDLIGMRKCAAHFDKTLKIIQPFACNNMHLT